MTNIVEKDNRIVMTLDAGGTNFVFTAIQDGKFIVDAVTLPSHADDLDKSLNSIVDGFNTVKGMLNESPVAISFAFPGPADYPNGIIGGFLPNFPAYREGVALAAYLEEKFGVPVFINNDADLFAYGEALRGRLPEINKILKARGSNKQYRNLLGYTFGTGFGFGFVSNMQLHIGDNSCVETFCLKHKHDPNLIAESGVSIAAIKHTYGVLTGNLYHNLEPKDIYDIAQSTKEGNREAAISAFKCFGEIAGDAIATAASLIDGIIVIGGGITAAMEYIMPSLLQEMRGTIKTADGTTLNRIQMDVYNLDDELELEQFIKGDSRQLKIYGTEKEIAYEPRKRIGVTTSKLGASNAIAIGAAIFALNKISLK